MVMADTAATFLNGLSDLWLRFFKDKNQLAGMYRGSEILVAQAYMKMLDTVLNLSIRGTPLYCRDYYKMLSVLETEVTFDPALNRYVYVLPDHLREFQLITNKVYAPTSLLRVDSDFEVNWEGQEDDQLRFRVNPFDWTGVGDTIPGFAVRTVEVDIGGTITEVRQLSMWLVDAQHDEYSLYMQYGQLLSHFSPSSEAYRAMLQGVMRYFILGPTLGHLLSTLNVCSGLAVIRDDGEILQSVSTADPLLDTVTTDRQTYSFPKGTPFREDVLDTSNWGTLTFEAYEVLTTVYAVKDAIADPTWWHNITIPAELTYDPNTMAPDTQARRRISPRLYDNLINNPPGLVRIGDPGFIIGADEDGFVPATRLGQRHLFSYIVFERFMKQAIFGVVVDPTLISDVDWEFPVWAQDLTTISMAGRPAYVYIYAEPVVQFEDAIGMQDDPVTFVLKPQLLDAVAAVDNVLRIGIRSWKIGDYYSYTAGPPPDVVVANGIANRAAGENQLCIGGVDPTHRELHPASDGGGANQATFAFGVTRKHSVVTTVNPVFEPGDVGKWVERADNGAYSQIITYVSSTQVIAYGDTGASLGAVAWYLWHDRTECTHDDEPRGGAVDWGVSLTVI